MDMYMEMMMDLEYRKVWDPYVKGWLVIDFNGGSSLPHHPTPPSSSAT